jgi:nucleoside-diphosphate-sugar epimerase
MNVLEGCRHNGVQHLVYASSSSVYGGNTKLPFSEHDSVDHPVSLYAATKKANELMAHTYSHLYGLPTTGLRFFTVYGPWGRPDMALFLFTKAILEGRPIDVFNHGQMQRDFTYVDDIVEGVIRVTDRVADGRPGYRADAPDPGTSNAPFRVFNIGNHSRCRCWTSSAASSRRWAAGREEPAAAAGRRRARHLCRRRRAARVGGLCAGHRHPHGIGRFVEWYRGYYEDLARVHDVVRVQRLLDGAHHRHRAGAGLVAQEAHLVQAHAVLAGAGAFQASARAPAARSALGQRVLRVVGVDQVAEVEVAVAHVADQVVGQPEASASATESSRQSARREIGTQVSVVMARQPGLLCMAAK